MGDFVWRRHQREALDALTDATASGRQRTWVVLPPGAGKTAVGVEHARRSGRRTVAFAPNTAIQAQWAATWEDLAGTPAATERDLAGTFTALTYQALAVFDPDAEADDDAGHVGRLHRNGRELVARLAASGPLLVVLDECHHLLQVWGELLAEVLDGLGDVQVLALTATPPELLTSAESALVARLFGTVTYAASLPAVVAAGDLAPFVELAWFVTPTSRETDWLAEQAARFAEFVAAVTDPTFASTGLLTWLDLRFGGVERPGVSWAEVVRGEPALADAVLRLHWAGHVALPVGARVGEAHRRRPAMADWMAVVGDWWRHCLLPSADPADATARERLRAALASVGYVATGRGLRRGPALVDRVLARSESKAHAAVEIVRAALADPAARLLVVTDHSVATAIPAGLADVLTPESGSAHKVLTALLADPATAAAHPLLVTGTTLGGDPATLVALAERAHGTPTLAEIPGETWSQLVGWDARAWVSAATRFLESDDADAPRVLVGTRALLGEGWDARRLTGVIDLTSATTTTAVTQTRGRALRTDPGNPDKVAVNWTVTCVSDAHPAGDADYARLVRKHDGWPAVDTDGEVVEGVGHCDTALSPYEAPRETDLAGSNARSLVRAADPDAVLAAWSRVDPNTTGPTSTIVVRGGRDVLAAGDDVALVTWRSAERVGVRSAIPVAPAVSAVLALAVTLMGLAATLPALAAGGLAGFVAAIGWLLVARGTNALAAARRPPTLFQLGGAVADALRVTGRVPVGAEGVRVEVAADGSMRCRLAGVDAAASRMFVDALDEVLSPLEGGSRYAVPRPLVNPGGGVLRRLGAAGGSVRPDAVVWHAVPTVLGGRRADADAFASAWGRWVGGGPAVYLGSSEGAGILAAQRGSDPFGLGAGTRVLRRVRW